MLPYLLHSVTNIRVLLRGRRRLAVWCAIFVVFLTATTQISPFALVFGCGCDRAQLERHLESTTRLHDVERLWLSARRRQLAKIERQSRNVRDARAEYLKRYSIEPPAGFDEWFSYAKTRGSLIVDDFDGLMQDVKPWRPYFASSCDLEKPPNQEPHILNLCFRDGNLHYPNEIPEFNKKEHVAQLARLVHDFKHRIPDLCLEWNVLDIPRVLLSAKQQQQMTNETFPYSTCPSTTRSWTEWKSGGAWETVTAFCPQSDSTEHGLIKDWQRATDLCRFVTPPSHGLLLAPSDMLNNDAEIPVFSAGTLSTFSDIRLPSVYRVLYPAKSHWDMLPCWRKQNSVGWRGSSTGAWATGRDVWQRFMRHRMVMLSAGISLPEVQATPRLRQWLDVRFSRITGCVNYTVGAELASILPEAGWEDLRDLYKHKILLDMDGNGLSGRLYHLMNSNSAVMKQGIFREWHDDRMVPWLHYIPLSTSMEELEELLAFLFGPGENIRKAIAEEGKQWVNNALRNEDMSIYLYRLLLEIGRRT